MTLRRSCRAGFRALLFSLCCSLPLLARAQAPAAAQQAAVVAARTAWDANYLYLAFQVDDADLSGTNTAPLSRAEQDDSVAVYLQVGPTRPGAPDENTHALVVSAAGGFTFLSGGTNGAPFTARPLRDLLGGGRAVKVAVTLQGTLNRPEDRDQRFTVEMAIPWSLVGVSAPAPDLVLGYNVVARSRGERTTALSSLGQTITEADVARPANFTTLTLRDTDFAPTSGAARSAPRVNETSAPRVDGVLTAGEWPERGLFAFAAPDRSAPVAATPVSVRPAAPLAAAPPIRLDAASAALVERLIFARYVLAFQGDPRKPAPFRGVRAAPDGGRFLLSDQPAEGAGPWFSSDRPAWHRQQLSGMRRLGVDVALTVVGGPASDADRADEKALLVLVSALQQMRAGNEAAPQLALYLDTARLAAPGGARPDLSTEAGRETLHRAVKRWMAIVPPEMRAQVQLPLASGGARAFPIFLSSAAPLSGLGEAGNDWVGDLRARFARDPGTGAGDATLLVVGHADFAPTTRLAAYLPPFHGAGGAGAGPLPTFVVQPGYDDTGARRGSGAAGAPMLRSRRDASTYREAWEAALAAGARWIVIDSWNDFARGTEIAASRQYGPRYLDLTRIYALQVNGLIARDVKWLGHDAPAVMRPLQVAAVEVLLQNAGATPLRGADGYALTYRWLQNDKVVADSPLRVRVPGTVFPTQTVRLPVGVAAARVLPEPAAAGRPKNAITVPRIEPLPPGDYVLEIDMTAAEAGEQTVFFGQNGDAPLRVPVRITGDAPEAAVFLGTTTPPLVQTGATYPVSVRLRWMGRDPLPAGAAALTYQLLPEQGEQTVVTATVSLTQAVQPGQTVSARANVRFADASGSAIAAAYPEAAASVPGTPAGYRLRWSLSRAGSPESVGGSFEERVSVYPDDREASLFAVPGKVPQTLEGAALVTIPVIVQNTGPTKWAKGEIFVGYHWFFPDGIEAQWRPPVTVAVDREVEPGRSVSVNVAVRAPERDGEYVLAFDALRSGGGDVWLSTQPLTASTADLALSRVRVTGGGLVYADLSKTYNVDAIAGASAPTDGDLDGAGATLPAEDFPPDAFGLLAAAPSLLVAPAENKKGANETPAPAYPSGYYADVSPTARRIGFRYGPKTPGAKNAVACQGQVIAVPAARYNGLNLAAASTAGEDKPLTLTLRYKDGSSETVTRTAASWTRSATEREAVAVQTPRKRTPTGDVPQTCALRHLIAPANANKELVSVTLPNDPAVKVFALTLEK